MANENWSWPGARWWRCDLHVHSPASHDFEKDSTDTAADLIAAAKTAGLDVIVITDHNTGTGVDEVRDGELVVFPGVELTVSPGVHLLAIFDQSRGRDAVTALLGRCGIPPSDFGKPEAISPKSVRGAMEDIAAVGALCIAAHVDDKKGVLVAVRPGEDLLAILHSPQLAAVEVKSGDPAFLKYVDGTIPDYVPARGRLAQIQSSDSHAAHDIGARSTWIKMTRPTLEGLRLALHDGGLSVKPHATGMVDPNRHANLAIESVVIANARHIGRQAPCELLLNPWLNALIGGRGTGKSSIVELLRAAMRRESELPVSLRKDWDEMVRVPEGRGARGILTADTLVTVVFRKDGARFRIQWDPAGRSTPIEVQQGDGAWVASPGRVAERFPIRIYSQKQVYELTRDSESLLGIVDEAPEVARSMWIDAWGVEENRFLSLRAQAREVRAALADESRVRGELEDVQRKLAVFEGAGHAEVLKRWQHRRRQERAIEARAVELGGVVDALASSMDALVPPPFDSSAFDAADPADAFVLQSAERVTRELARLHADAQKLVESARAMRDGWLTSGGASPWHVAREDAEGAYGNLIEALRAAGGGDPAEYGRLVQQRQLLETRLSTFAGKQKTLDALAAQASESLARLHAMRRELTERRTKFLANVLAENPFVRIEVLPMGSVGSMGGELRRLLGRDDGAFQRDLGEPGEAGTLVGDCAADYVAAFQRADASARVDLLTAHEDRVAALKKKLWEIHAGTGQVVDKRFAQHMVGRPPEQMDRLDAWFPADTLRVSFKGKRKDFQPIEQGSPGQRSAALLAFLLSHGEEPIVLDQPEDDLDNQLVYELIVQQLRTIKTRRQVVVVTHNANIVVNGDAELVVALDVTNGQASPVCAGGLQEQAIRDQICRVMEGGPEAFRERYRRIAQGDGDV